MPRYVAPSGSSGGTAAIVDDSGTPALASGITEAEVKALLNLSDGDIVVAVQDEGTLDLTGNVTIAAAKTLLARRLRTVTSSSGTLNLTESNHAGRYVIRSATGTVTLPSSSAEGEHYTILNTSSGNVTIDRNNNLINGATSDFTLGTFNAVTCIGIGSNNWIALG